MKTLIWGIIVVILMLLASYVAISEEPSSFVLKRFVIDGNRENIETGYNNLKTFVIGQKPTGWSDLVETKKGNKCARERNRRYQRMEEEIDKCIKKITKNWKRTYARTSYWKVYEDANDYDVDDPDEEHYFEEVIGSSWGYDKDKDTRLRWKLKDKFLNGEKIC